MSDEKKYRRGQEVRSNDGRTVLPREFVGIRADELTALRAEVTRLRGALQNVLNTSTEFPVRAIARQALDTHDTEEP